VFDDVVDALATGGRRLSRWTPSTSRAVGLTAGVLALLAGAVALPFAGPPYSIGGLIGAALAATLLVAAMVFARALGDARTGTAFALVATVYAGVGGLLVLAGDTPPSSLTVAHVAVAATLAMVAATVASIGVPGATPVFLAAGVVAAAVLATMGLAALFDIRPAAGAAVTVLAASATLPLLPMLAYRLVGLPVPNVPTERDQLLSDGENVNGIRILELARRADAFLAALVSALAVIVAGTALLVAGGRAARASSRARAGTAVAGPGPLVPAPRAAAAAAAGGRGSRSRPPRWPCSPGPIRSPAWSACSGRRSRSRPPASASAWPASGARTRRCGAACWTWSRCCSSSPWRPWSSGRPGCSSGSAPSAG
jgi:hypothetical protein